MNLRGFTLIELLVVIAVLGVLATVVLVAVNPGAQFAKTRDATRKSDISQIAKAIEAFAVFRGSFPAESPCQDSSKGAGCVVNPPVGSDWDSSTAFYQGLVGGGYLSKLPIDPVNDSTYNYQYEPTDYTVDYWIGARLEKPANASLPFFRCAYGGGFSTPQCKEVSGWYL